ncbi:MAG: efflux RND transporter permease subunit [Treponema sp.]|nr:efflux RND transporter permease subunit [Treponema sp.]
MEKLFKKPVIILVIVGLVTAFFCVQLPKVELDNNNLRFIPDSNPSRIIAEYIDETFGGQVVILVGLERPFRTIFDREFLQRIRRFSRTVENVSLVKSVNSIMSTQYITGDSESIIVTDLVPEYFSGTQEEITELKRRIASWDLFKGALVSEDLSATQILITLDVLTIDSCRPEVSQALNQIKVIADEIFKDEARNSAEIYFAGITVINTVINESIIEDNILLLPLAVIVVLALLFISFRRMIFVVLPISTAIISVVWTIGLAAMLGVKLSTITTIMPIILVAVGHAYGIHVITHYVKDIREKILTIEEHREIVFDLMRKMLKPVFLAAITTITGFISFCFTPIIPMMEFGMYTSIGVLSVFLLTVFFIPAVLLLRGPKKIKTTDKENINEQGEDPISNKIADIFLSIAGRKKMVLACTLLIILVSIAGVSRIIVDNSIIDFFRNETDVNRADRFVREYFGGSKELSLIVTANTTEELLHPDVLKAIDDLSVYLNDNVQAVGKAVGFTDIIKRMNQVFNVDQSPDGIKPAANAPSQADSFGFGSFGFGNNDDSGFGFGGFGFNDTLTADEVSLTPENMYSDQFTWEQYNASDILRFFDAAAGLHPAMNGNDLVRELKRLTNYEGASYYEIPYNPERYGKSTREELQQLIANYLFLLAGSDNNDYSNDPLEPTAIRTMIQLRTTGSSDTYEVINLINDYIAVNFPGNIQTMIGGGATQEIAVTDLILNSQIISIAISVLMIFIIVSIANKSFAAGIISAVPLMLAVLCNFTVMGLFGIKLNLGTALIASLTVCIGIDDAIHFLEFYKREHKTDKNGSLRRTFIACGRAICTTAMSVGIGFAVLAFSKFKIIAEFGLLTALCMLSTTIVSLTIMPVLLAVFKPKFIYGGKEMASALNKIPPQGEKNEL